MRTFDLYSPVVFELKPKLPHFQIDSVHWDNKVVRHCPINNFPCLQHFFAALYQQHNGSVRQNSRAILWMMPSKKYAAEKKRGKMAPDGTKKWQQKNATKKMPPENGTRGQKKGTKNGTKKMPPKKCHRKMAPDGTKSSPQMASKNATEWHRFEIAPKREKNRGHRTKLWIDRWESMVQELVHRQKDPFFNKYKYKELGALTKVFFL